MLASRSDDQMELKSIAILVAHCCSPCLRTNDVLPSTEDCWNYWLLPTSIVQVLPSIENFLFALLVPVGFERSSDGSTTARQGAHQCATRTAIDFSSILSPLRDASISLSAY